MKVFSLLLAPLAMLVSFQSKPVLAALTKETGACPSSNHCPKAGDDGGQATIGQDSCTTYKSCQEVGKNKGDVTIGKKSCTGSSSCIEAGENDGKATIGNESCTSNLSCDDVAKDKGDAIIGNKSCTGSKSCQDVGQKNGKATIDNESCTQNESCVRAGEENGDVTIGKKSCTSSESCEDAGEKNGKATIGNESCTKNKSCYEAGADGSVAIGNKSCTGSNSCEDAGEKKGKATIGNESCTQNDSCRYAGEESGKATIGNESCTNNEACESVGKKGGDITIGDKSCTGGSSCKDVVKGGGTVVIGSNSCTCYKCCTCLTDGDTVPDNSCQSLGECCNTNYSRNGDYIQNLASSTEDIDIVLQVPDESPNPNCPRCKATGFGDPHIVTFDGLAYDVHVKGELTFLKSLNNDFTIQARTQIVSNHPKGPAVTTGVLVHENSDFKLPVVQVSLGKDALSDLATMIGECPVQLFVDGQANDIKLGTGSSDVVVQVKNNRIVVEYPSTQLRIDMQVRVWRSTCHFSVTYFLADCRCDDSLVGILGRPDGDVSNEWHQLNGTPEYIPQRRRGREAYEYSMRWCLDDAASHFTYEPGTNHGSFDSCTSEDFDLDIDELITEADATTIDKCTIADVLDEGCVVESAFLGLDAVEEYVNVIQEAVIVEIPEPPTSGPTSGPTFGPTKGPTSESPTKGPTKSPTKGPTESPTKEPTESPTKGPTETPTKGPTKRPTKGPTKSPTKSPTKAPSPTVAPPTGSNGDPHFKTWKHEHFEFHGQCDMILAKDPKFANGVGLDVQIRTKMVRFWSYIRTAAIRIGNDILEIQGSVGDEDRDTHYWLNFQYQADATTVGGFPLTITSNGAHKRYFEIDLDSKFSGQKIVLSAFKEFVAVDFKDSTTESFGNTVGMLGDYQSGKTFARDGVAEINDFNELGNEWQLLPSDDMLFHDKAEPQYPKRCILPEDPQGQRRRRLDESSINVEKAEAICATLKDPLSIKDCVYDILATQDLDMVGAF